MSPFRVSNYSPNGDPLPPPEPSVFLHSEDRRLVNEALGIAPEGDKASLKQVVEKIGQSPPE